jgi:hypothetical protein
VVSARPNFTDVLLDGPLVTVSGTSDPRDFADILDIRVVLSQGAQAAGGPAAMVAGPATRVGSSWKVDLSSAGFVAGPAVAFGVESRRENFTTTTWAQPVNIAPK